MQTHTKGGKRKQLSSKSLFHYADFYYIIALSFLHHYVRVLGVWGWGWSVSMCVCVCVCACVCVCVSARTLNLGFVHVHSNTHSCLECEGLVCEIGRATRLDSSQ